MDVKEHHERCNADDFTSWSNFKRDVLINLRNLNEAQAFLVSPSFLNISQQYHEAYRLDAVLQ